MTTLNDLPYDIKKYVLIPLLDNISRLLLRNALIGAFEDLPREVNKATQKDICKYDAFFFYRYQDYVNKDKVMKYCAINGNIGLLEELKTKYFLGYSLINAAAKYSKLETFIWATENGVSILNLTLQKAAFSGCIAILRWVVDKGYNLPNTIIAAAAEGASLSVIQWLHSKKYEWHEETCLMAAKNGHLDILKWIRAQNPPAPWNSYVCDIAVQNNHCEVVKWLLTNNCPYDGWSVYYAIGTGNLELVEVIWNRDNSIKIWSKNLCNCTAHANLLHILIFLHKNNIFNGEDICMGAASSGNLEILKWALENGAPWNDNIRDHIKTIATEKNNLELLEWVREK